MRGMSLIEVLVALVVLSIGLLGIAQVLIHGMRTSHVNLVADMAERIRANPDTDELAEWREAVRAALPEASAEVSRSTTGAMDHFSVRVSWTEPGESQPLSESADIVLVRR
jgi:type IV pilus assembly protein PilV